MEDVEKRRRRKGRWIEDVENMKDNRCREEEGTGVGWMEDVEKRRRRKGDGWKMLRRWMMEDVEKRRRGREGERMEDVEKMENSRCRED
jgi:hypothetical protein